jgi:hypothetical protein
VKKKPSRSKVGGWKYNFKKSCVDGSVSCQLTTIIIFLIISKIKNKNKIINNAKL